jgi:hypothetical protein
MPWTAVCVFNVGAVAWTLAVNTSNDDRLLVSVAVTFRLRLCMITGAVPLNVSVAALKESQLGSAWPFESVAA